MRSIEAKVKYIMDRKLGGAMLWSLDMDDFTGRFCNQGSYPLLSTINYYLNPSGSGVSTLPDESVIRRGGASGSSGISDEVNNRMSIKSESDFFRESSKSEKDVVASSFNVFNLINNDGIN